MKWHKTSDNAQHNASANAQPSFRVQHADWIVGAKTSELRRQASHTRNSFPRPFSPSGGISNRCRVKGGGQERVGPLISQLQQTQKAGQTTSEQTRNRRATSREQGGWRRKAKSDKRRRSWSEVWAKIRPGRESRLHTRRARTAGNDAFVRLSSASRTRCCSW